VEPDIFFTANPIQENITPKTTASFENNLILGKASNSETKTIEKINPNSEYRSQVLVDEFI
tara:strand:- start:182 stop:364 length:183 start_codon:yes stop_codon:yes gene_type:complete